MIGEQVIRGNYRMAAWDGGLSVEGFLWQWDVCSGGTALCACPLFLYGMSCVLGCDQSRSGLPWVPVAEVCLVDGVCAVYGFPVAVGVVRK